MLGAELAAGGGDAVGARAASLRMAAGERLRRGRVGIGTPGAPGAFEPEAAPAASAPAAVTCVTLDRGGGGGGGGTAAAGRALLGTV